MKRLFLLLLTIFFAHTLQAQNSKNYALFFAVNEYSDGQLNDLQNPIKNAKDLAAELEEKYGFQAKVFENPTRSIIERNLRQYKRDFENGTLSKDAQLLIYFTGHGDFDEDFKQGYFIPSDGKTSDLQASSILYESWRNFINNLNCKHILVAIDACYSGTFDKQIAMRSRRFERPNELGEKEKMLLEHSKRKTRLYLCSGAKEKTPDRSFFAKRFLEALRNNQKDILTAGNIFYTYMDKVQPKPVFGEFGDDEASSSFIFLSDGNTISRPSLEIEKRPKQKTTETIVEPRQSAIEQKDENTDFGMATEEVTKILVDEVLRVTGHSQNFRLVPNYYTPKVAAGFNGTQRILNYNPEFIRQIYLEDNPQWIELYWLLHEMGHHVEEHLAYQIGSDLNAESAADLYAGYAMKQMEASPQDMQTTLNQIKLSFNYNYPISREAAFKQGYNGTTTSNTSTTTRVNLVYVGNTAIPHTANTRITIGDKTIQPNGNYFSIEGLAPGMHNYYISGNVYAKNMYGVNQTYALTGSGQINVLPNNGSTYYIYFAQNNMGQYYFYLAEY